MVCVEARARACVCDRWHETRVRGTSPGHRVARRIDSFLELFTENCSAPFLTKNKITPREHTNRYIML